MSAVDPFPEGQYWKAVETDETFIAGSYLNSEFNIQLMQIVFTFYKKDTGLTNFLTSTLVCKLWHDEAMTRLHATSETLNMSDIPTALDWRGNIPFNFGEQFLLANQTYYVSLTPANYTRNAYDVYMAFALDWPLPINSNTAAPRYGCAMEFIGKKKVTY